MDCLHGITNVYKSAEASGFGDADNYPIAWEVIALHNAAGRCFVQLAKDTFNRMQRSAGYVLNLDAKREDSIFCLECVFRDKAAFLRVINECMSNVVIYDEHRKSPVLKPMLLEEAAGLTPVPVLETV